MTLEANDPSMMLLSSFSVAHLPLGMQPTLESSLLSQGDSFEKSLNFHL